MENIQFADIAKDTPAYVFDIDALVARVAMIKDKIAPAKLCYAMKANPFLVRPLIGKVDRFEVCSPGEYEICHNYGVEPSQIVVSGVNKTYESMKRIMLLSGGAGIFTIESMRHYEIFNMLCKELSMSISIIIRLTSGNQFGVDKDTFTIIAQKVIADENMKLCGIHYYSGTQKKDSKIQKELDKITEFVEDLRVNKGIEVPELEYGPGLSVAYFKGDEDEETGAKADNLRKILDGLNSFECVTIELGRYIAYECGYFVTNVVDLKKNGENITCLIDGGIHQLNYYGQMMGMMIPYIDVISSEVSDDTEIYNIHGSLCTVSDVITRGVELSRLSIGDTLIFKRCGAYSVTEGIALFLSRSLPQIKFYTKECGFVTVRDTVETYIINSQREGD